MNRIIQIFKPPRLNHINSVRKFSSSLEESIYKLSRKSLVYCEKDGHIVKSPYESFKVPEMTVDRHIWSNLQNFNQNLVAVECATTGRILTYAKLRDHSAALAIRLRSSLGLDDGDIVAVCLPNVPEYPISLLGSIQSNLKVSPINPGYSPREIAYQLKDCQVKAVFCEASHFNHMKQACALAQLTETKIIVLKSGCDESIPVGAINFEELIDVSNINLSEASKFNDDVDPDETVILPYSSGTTGLPKGVMHSHKSFIANADQANAKVFFNQLTLPTTNEFQEVLPCFLPFYHIYGLCNLLYNKLSLGCKIVSMRSYDVNLFLEVLSKHKATLLALVPPVVIQLGHHPAVKPAHFQSVRLILSAASSLGEEDALRFLKKAANTKFIQAYGMTEGFISTAPPEISNYGTVGFPLSNVDVKIVSTESSNLKGLPANDVGEILFRGPNVMKGYYKNDKATKETFTEDGWLRTGDIGYYNENGNLFVIERLKELIKVNAMQVPPAELEIILRNHPDVMEAAVVGIKHPKCGEVPKAFVVRKPGSKTKETEIQDYVAKQVSKHKQLTGGVTFIESIPKSAAGKILRREVKRLYT